MKKFILLYFTVRNLRCKQLLYRVISAFNKPKISAKHEVLERNNWVWSSPRYMPQSLWEDKASFLLEDQFIDKEIAWNASNKSKLWLYNLHYFDDLNSVDCLYRTELHLDFVLRWIAENPPCIGNGWEPYPTSLRLVNWIKWYRRSEMEDEAIVCSIAQQAEALSKQLEYHILGNHLFANAKALIFVGCFLRGAKAQRYMNLGLKVLEKEIPEQFLADGGHFELSPMYHCILLWDLLDLINLAHITAKPELVAVTPYWKKIALGALQWLKVMQHPDGEVSFFNDSAIGIAATPAQLFSYAASLNLFVDESILPELITLPDSGYSRVTMSEHCLLFDHAAVGPDYLPAHAHADTLSLEWSVGQERILVNSGTSVYGVSHERLRQRQTAAHNTVLVDNADSSEVWSGFRVARRAYAKLIEAEASDNKVVLTASHNGYMRLKGKVTHQRKIESSTKKIDIYDCLFGRFSEATVHWHLHPNLIVERMSDVEIRLTTSNGKCIYLSCNAPLMIRPSSWHPRFGETVSSTKVTADFTSQIVHTCLSID